MYLIVLIFSHLMLLTAVSGSPQIEGISHTCYAIQRDLNLVFLTSVRRNTIDDNGNRECSKTDPVPPWRPFYGMAFKYAIDKINTRNDLLPNISLGFIILDRCSIEMMGLAVSMYLTPDTDDTNIYPSHELVTCDGGRYGRFSNVLGMLGPGYSRLAVMLVPVLGLYEIPVLLTSATSDELSDKSRYPYSLRLRPPDRFTADAMTDLLLHYNWTYASIVYMEGSFGENGAKQLHKNAKKKGICIAFSFMFPSIYTDEHVTAAVDGFIENQKARVILAYVSSSHVNAMGLELFKRGYSKYFTWVGSDSFYWDTDNPILKRLFDGSFYIRFKPGKNEEFRNYYNSLTPQEFTNPWLLEVWENEKNCTWNKKNTDKQSCNKFMNTTLAAAKAGESQSGGTYFDGVSIYAQALHRLITENCPQTFVDKSLLADCVKGPLLAQYMRNTSIDGYLGPVQFDEYGDSLGNTWLVQYHSDIGDYLFAVVFNGLTGELKVDTEKIQWLSDSSQSNAQAPESVCSYPCAEKQYYIQKELPCCWECRECRENEVIVKNSTACEICPTLTWPDEDSATICVVIEPTVVRLTDPISIVLMALVGLGVALCLTVGFIFIKNKDVKIIKASSHQLMTIMLIGIIVAFATSIVYLLKPSITSCFVTRFGFNLAVSLIYSPLVVKTSRVYRIFTAGKVGKKKPGFIGNRAQMLMVTVLILLQLSLCVLSVLIAYPEPKYHMPVETTKYVEVSCSLPLEALLPPLSFNILLSIICAGFGFVTRKLPANFNESWFIFVSVATTSFLWVVFLPAYFTAFYTLHQKILLVSCLYINGLVTLTCLYVPKVYAIYFVDDSKLNLQTAGSMSTVGTAPTNQSGNCTAGQ